MNFSYRQSHKVKNSLLLKKDGHSSNIQAIIKNLDIVPTKRKLGIEAIQEAYQFDCTFLIRRKLMDIVVSKKVKTSLLVPIGEKNNF